MKKGNNIYKRKDGRWEARYVKGKKNGHIQYGYCYGKTYAQALQKQVEMKELIVQGIDPTTIQAKDVAELCEQWLIFKKPHIKPATYDKYYYVVKRHIEPNLGQVLLKDLTTLMIDQFIQILFDKGLGIKTIRDILSIFHSILEEGANQYPHLSKLRIILPRENKAPARVLSKDEQSKLIQYLLKDMDPCKFGTLLALMTGLRIGELCALKWKDISLKESMLVVSNTMLRLRSQNDQGKKTEIIISTPKSLSSVRRIPLSDSIKTLCTLFQVNDPEAYILTGRAYQYIEPRTLQNIFKRYLQQCDLENVHFHTLRHTFATRCVEAGVEIKALSEMLGHASCQITLDTYVHISMDLKRQSMARLEQQIHFPKL